MATTIAKVYTDQHIVLKTGELDETFPVVQDGLVAHYEFDSTTNGRLPNQNLLDSSVWVIGTSGSQGTFYQNGETGENQIISKSNPWGYNAAVWATLGNDATSNADGGWDTASFSVDRTKKYRYTTWIRRENTGDGRTYFGCGGSSVYDLGTTNINTNPYFAAHLVSDIPSMANNWVLFVGIIHEFGYTGGYSGVGGVYTMNGIKVSNLIEFQWANNVTTSNHRTYLYYSTSTTERQYWYDPRVEVVDGYTSTVSDLLKRGYNFKYATDTINLNLNTYGVGISTGQVNYINNPTGNSGAGVPGSYQPGWDNVLHPMAFSCDNWSGGYNGGVGAPSVGYHAQWVNEGPDGSACMKFIDKNTQFGYAHRWLGINQYIGNVDTSWGLVTGQKWVTLSWDQKVDTIGKYSSVGLYHLRGGSHGFYDALASHSNTVINQWERITWTYRVTNAWDAGTWMYFYFYGMDGAEGTLWIDNVQFEVSQEYNSVFFPGAASYSQLSVQNPVTTGNFTINFWCKILPKVGTSILHASIFSMGGYYTTNSFTIMDYSAASVSGEQMLIRKGAGDEWAWANGAFTTPSNYQNWNMYTIVRGSTNYDCYLNGVYKGTITHLSTTMQSLIWLGSRDSGGQRTPSYFKKLSIYNKALSTDEINRLAKGGISFRSNGNLMTNYLNEVNPNLWPNAELSTTTYGSQGPGTVTLEINADGGGTYHQMVLTSQSGVEYTYRGYSFTTLENGASYIASGYFWVSAGNNLNYKTFEINNATWTGPDLYFSSLPTNTWTYVSRAFTADASLEIYIYPTAWTPCSGTVRWRNICVRKVASKPLKTMSTRDLYIGDLIEE